jgi:hypothetical protein
MEAVVVFLGVAVVAGCLIRAFVALRRRVVARRPGATEQQICSLDQAGRISSKAVVASLVCLAVVGLAYVLV